jgi:hypothetical protein
LSGERAPPIDQEPVTVRVKAEVISLDAVAEREGLSVADQIALQDAEQRKAITGRMLQTFIAANTVTLVGVAPWWCWTKSTCGRSWLPLVIASSPSR